jgi:hypothetical protein
MKIPKAKSETVYRGRTDNTVAKRYQRGNQKRISKKNRQHSGQKIPKGNQKPYIEEEQTTQWPKDTKGEIRNRISNKNRQHNGQKKKYKRTNNDLQNIHIKIKIK